MGTVKNEEALPAAVPSPQPCEEMPTECRRQWRPISEDNPDGTWTTFSEADVIKAKSDYPWIRFQSRLISEWTETVPPQGPLDSGTPQAEPLQFGQTMGGNRHD